MYRVALEGFRDFAGNRIPAGIEAEVTGDGEPDRRRPSVVSLFPPPDARFVPPDARLVIHFSEPMKSELEFEFWVASDTTAVADGAFDWPLANKLRFSPSRPWPEGEAVRLTGRASRLSDLSGNHPTQTVHFGFSVIDSANLGKIEGRIDPGDASVIVRARRLAAPDVAYETGVAAGDSLYTLAWLPPGVYVVSGFLDLDGDGEWTPGAVRPFVHAEPVSEMQDTLEVRARWATISERHLAFIQTDSIREESRESPTDRKR